jgi:steroid 5-alpha reductase family enzyme
MSDDTPPTGRSGSYTRNAWLSWLAVAILCNAIWLVGWVTGSHDHVPYYWPIWVMVPWGAVILATTITNRGR